MSQLCCWRLALVFMLFICPLASHAGVEPSSRLGVQDEGVGPNRIGFDMKSQKLSPNSAANFGQVLPWHKVVNSATSSLKTRIRGLSLQPGSDTMQTTNHVTVRSDQGSEKGSEEDEMWYNWFENTWLEAKDWWDNFEWTWYIAAGAAAGGVALLACCGYCCVCCCRCCRSKEEPASSATRTEPVTQEPPSPLPDSTAQPTQQQPFTTPPPQPQPSHFFHPVPGQQPQFGTVPLQHPMSGGPFTQPMAQSVFMPGQPGHFSVPALVYADGAQHQFRPMSAAQMAAPQMAPIPAAVQPPGADSDDEAADEKEDTVVSSKTYAVNRQGILAKISLLLPTSPEATRAELLFRSSWEGRTSLGEVRSVLRIENQTIQARFDAYKSALPTPNVRQRFHGTSRECDFCVDAEAPPCKEYSCALCSICAQSFSLEASGAGPNANNAVARALPAGGRYGRGLYFTRASSKANDYSVKVGEGDGKTRVVFLCEVAEGLSYEAPNTKMEDAESELATLLRARGQGQYDSVVAEGWGDGPLNYHEVVVYDKDAVLPKYLIVYTLAQ